MRRMVAGTRKELVGQSGHPLLSGSAAPTGRSMHQRIALLTILVGIAGGAAYADPVDDLNLQLADWADRSERLASAPLAYDAKLGPELCSKVIDDAIAAGISPTQSVTSYAFRRHPKAKPVEGRDVYSITLDEARTYCTTYERHFRFAAEWATFDKANTWRDIYVNGAPLPDERKQAAHELADQCRAAWERAKQAGVPDDLPTTMDVAKTFREVRGKVCDGLDKATNNLAKNISAATEAVRKKYEAAGITGKKLELMIQYDGVYWRLPGGGRTDDPKKLGAASVLFQWLEGEDRDDPRYVIHTIRKYRFKGDKLLGTSEKTYRRKKGVDVGNVFK